MKFETYLLDALMRDLVGHSRSPAAFLVYLQLYRHSIAAGRESVSMSHAMMADSTGLSKRAVQSGVALLSERQLVSVARAHSTAVPVYTVLTPWRRIASPRGAE